MESSAANSLFYLPLAEGFAAATSAGAGAGAGAGTSKSSESWFIGDAENSVLTVLQDLRLIDSDSWPIVLYGPPLAGKSTLGLSLANRLARLRGFEFRTNLKVVAISAADWAYQVRESLETDSLLELRRRFLRAGSILFDDLQGLESSPFAQNQLVTLLDLLKSAGIPVVVTLPQISHRMESLCPQLVSRLDGGLVLPVHLPGPAARKAILEALMNSIDISLQDEALGWLASSGIATNFVALRTMLEQIKTHDKLSKSKQNLTPSRIRQIVRGGGSITQQEKLCHLIVDVVGKEFSLEPSQICGSSRRQTTVQARGIAMTYIRHLTSMGFAAVGQYFDGRDHSTTMHAIQKTLAKIEQDSNFEKTVDQIFRKIRTQAASAKIPIPDSWKTCWSSVDSC